jgi:hypothetical protein
MEAGLQALKQGQDQEAIQIFETFCQNAVPNSREYLRAQMHLVKIYQNLEQKEQAIALCQQLLICPNAQVQIWSQHVLKSLGITEVGEKDLEPELNEEIGVETVE